MNDFDRFLEIELERMLDPVAATPAPPFMARRKRTGPPLLAVVTAPIELAAEMVVSVDSAPVAVPVVAGRLIP